MPIREEKLEKALYLTPYDELKNRINERDLTPDGRTKDDYVECLLADDWSDDELDSLVDWLQDRKKESEPVGYFVCKITGVTNLTEGSLGDDFRSILLETPARFDERDKLETEGYEVIDSSESAIEATYWTKSENHKLDPAGNIRTNTTLYSTGFKIDFESNLLMISTDNFGKAQGLKNQLKEIGLDLAEVGHQNLINEEANDRMQEFVDDLEESVSEVASAPDDNQRSLEEFSQ